MKVAFGIINAALCIKCGINLPRASVLSCRPYRTHKNMNIKKIVSLKVIRGKTNIILGMYFLYGYTNDRKAIRKQTY